MTAKVLVIGAGPVGLTLAIELQRYGIDFRIVEQAAARTDKSKALVIWSRTLELLERSGLSDRFVAAGRKVDAANIIAGSKRIAHIGFHEVDSPYPYALIVPQSDSERLLEAALAERGIKVERQIEAVAIASDSGGATVSLRNADGRTEDARFDWVIGCDGAHSIVRHSLGMTFEGNTLPSDFILADVHLRGFPVPENELGVYWHEDGVLAVFPITPGRFRIVADLGVSDGPQPRAPSLEDVQEVVDRRGPGGVTVTDPVWLSGFRINERKVKDYRAGRLFLVGDAAHIHSPAGGQGMNTGMQDAFNLAWKLALVVKGVLPDGAVLDSYSPERSAIGDKVLADAGRLTALVLMRNHTAQAARNLIGGFVFGLAPVRRNMAKTLTEVTIGYPDSPINGPHIGAGPAAGARVPPVAGQVPAGAGDSPRFALCTAADDSVRELCIRHVDILESNLRPPLVEGAVHLIRPDGYVACAVAAGDAERIDAYLSGLKGNDASRRSR
jgi:2-polyprenyl-6-methoxyphenol hydroxylase-like FAD-dependent oxidoreductase